MTQDNPLQTYNPFTEVTLSKHFVGRETALMKFHLSLNGLRARTPRHQYVVGVHGTGKTSYLRRLVEIAQEQGFLSVIPTLDEYSVSPRQHISTILSTLIKGLDDYLNTLHCNQETSKLIDDWDSGSASKYFSHPRTNGLEAERIRRDCDTIRTLMQQAHLPGALICIDEGQRIDAQALSLLKNALQGMDCYLVFLSLRLVQDTTDSLKQGRLILDQKAQEAEGDYGASRFYVGGISMGPFDTDQEAYECIRRRLDNNNIKFDDAVTSRISTITGRVPREIVSFASLVYERAIESNVRTVDVALLNSTFREVHNLRMSEAVNLCENLSEARKPPLRGLLKLNGASSSAVIAQFIYPHAPTNNYASLTEGVQVGLKHICQVSSLVVAREDKYELNDPVSAYALALALGEV